MPRFRVTVMVVRPEDSEPHRFFVEAQTHAAALLRVIEETCGEPLDPEETLATYAEQMTGEELTSLASQRTTRAFYWSVRNLAIGVAGFYAGEDPRTAQDDELGLPPDRTVPWRVENLALRADPNDYGPIPEQISTVVPYEPFPAQRHFHVGHSDPATREEERAAADWLKTMEGQLAVAAASKKKGSHPGTPQAQHPTAVTEGEKNDATPPNAPAHPHDVN
jgi:hypothetical protein